MTENKHQNIFPLSNNNPATKWRKLDSCAGFIQQSLFEGERILKVDCKALELLAETAFYDISHYLRSDHLAQLKGILNDDGASANDRFVALDLLRNSQIAAAGVLPMCQ